MNFTGLSLECRATVIIPIDSKGCELSNAKNHVFIARSSSDTSYPLKTLHISSFRLYEISLSRAQHQISSASTSQILFLMVKERMHVLSSHYHRWLPVSLPQNIHGTEWHYSPYIHIHTYIQREIVTIATCICVWHYLHWIWQNLW